MKTILEYLVNGHIQTYNYDDIYTKTKPTQKSVTYPFTFAEFVETINADTLARDLKQCWKDAAKDSSMGRFTFMFEDGNLGVEIMTMPSGVRTNGGKWWREVFVQKKDLQPGKEYITSWEYNKEFAKAGENGLGTFSSKWGDRLVKTCVSYIEYLKNNFEKFTL